jgi:hypothetical protein
MKPMKRLWLALALCASLFVPAAAQEPPSVFAGTVPGIPIS